MFIVAYDVTGKLIYVRRLTRKQYYHDSKINAHGKRVLLWNRPLQDLYASLSQNHFKTCDPNAFLTSINNYAQHYEIIWKRMAGSRKWRRGKFYLYQQKKKTIDLFLHSLKIKSDSHVLSPKSGKKNRKHRRGRKTFIYNNHVMLYGAGQFPSGAKGERYVPLKYVKKCCKNHFECHEVNEFRTSQICPDCMSCRLSDVAKYDAGRVKKISIRGLKWCPSEACRHNPLKNRDICNSEE